MEPATLLNQYPVLLAILLALVAAEGLCRRVHGERYPWRQTGATLAVWIGQVACNALFRPLVVIGFHLVDVCALLAANLPYQFILHTTVVPKLAVLDKIFNTPANHRVHHSCEAPSRPEFRRRADRLQPRVRHLLRRGPATR